MEKMDRSGVRFQNVKGGKPIVANVWYNPKKNDVRIRHEQLRAAGQIGDILVLRAPPSKANVDYEFEVVKPADSQFSNLDAACTVNIPNSKKRIGYV